MKKIVYGILLLSILLISFGCTKVAVKTDPTCEELTEDDLIGTNFRGNLESAKIYCYEVLAEDSGELGYCEAIRNIRDDQEEIDGCYESIAIAHDDGSICDKIRTKYIKDDCYYYVAINTYNEGLCHKISTTMKRGECIRDI